MILYLRKDCNYMKFFSTCLLSSIVVPFGSVFAQSEVKKAPTFSDYIPLFLVIGLVYYWFIIKPQIENSKNAQQLRDELAKGEFVSTTGGIVGKITGFPEDGVVAIETSPQCTITIEVQHILKKGKQLKDVIAQAAA